MRRWNLFAVALLLVAPSALSAQDYDEEMDHTDATEAITAASEAFEAAWNAGDWAALGALYAADAVVMPPGSEAVTGSDAIVAFMATREDGLVLGLETTEVFSVEGKALEVGDWTMTGPDGTHLGHGNYMVAWGWSEENGWQMARDMWNDNMAPAGN